MVSLSAPYLGVGLQVVEQDVNGCGQVPAAEGVRPVPTLSTKLAPLSHHCVEVTECKQNAFELDFFGAHLQGILRWNERERGLASE